jgi:beta-lactamase class A
MQTNPAYYRRTYERTLFSSVVPYIVLLAIGAVLGFLVVKVTQSHFATPLPDGHITASIEFKPLKEKNRDELERIIASQMNESIPRYSIIVEDYQRALHVELGDQIVYSGASIHKIPILLSLMKEIYEKRLSWDKEILFEESDRQDYGTGSIRYQPAGKTYTIRELTTLMMEKSDNTAAYILGRRVLNFDLIQKNLESWGSTDTSMEENTTTNTDIALLLKKLFSGSILSAEATSEAIQLLDDSDFEDRLPALLPAHTKIYHKIGTAIAQLHDIGVVATDNSLYYIGVFTKDVSDEEEATKTISRISKAVYDYMEE